MKMSVSRKIALFVGLLVLVLATGLGIVAIQLSSRAVVDEVEAGMLEYAIQGASRVDESLSGRLLVLEEVASRPDVRSMDIDLVRTSLQSDVEQLGYLDMALVTPDGMAHYVVSGDATDLSTRDYIQRALAGESNVSDVIVSLVTDSTVLMYAAPVYSDGQITGALIGRRDGNALAQITNSMGIGETGYAFVIGSDGTIYAHDNAALVMEQRNAIEEAETGGDLAGFGQALQELGIGNTGMANYEFLGSTRLTAMAPIPGTQWMLGLGAIENDVLLGVNQLRNALMLIALIFLAAGVAAAWLLGRSIGSPVKELAGIIGRLSNYDFSFDENSKAVAYVKRGDEIGAITRALATMQTNVTDLIKTIQNRSEQVAASSEELTATSEESAGSAQEVAKSIDEIARGASDQARDTEQGAVFVEELGGRIEENSSRMNDLNLSVEEVDRLKEEGVVILQELVAKTEENNRAAGDIGEVISQTHQSAEKIESASQMIRSIAEQTNLLALNAAIEAARAGEHGRGFAVVADEIRKLAEQSNGFTEEIGQVIGDLISKVDQAVRTIEDVGEAGRMQTESVQETRRKFDGISQAIEAVKTVIGELNVSGEAMVAKKQEIIGVIGNLSAISEENAAGTQEASASIEQQTAAVQEIARASDELARIAEEMQQEVRKFKY